MDVAEEEKLEMQADGEEEEIETGEEDLEEEDVPEMEAETKEEASELEGEEETEDDASVPAPQPEGKKHVAGLPKPVTLGEELEVTIESVGAKGDGIAKKDGFVIFVAGVHKGETVKIKITELKTSFAIGEKV